jgi:hypothetical protein
MRPRRDGVLGQFFCDADIVGNSGNGAMSHVNWTFHTASIALGTSFMPAGLRRSVFTADVASSNYPVFKGPATL